MTARIGCVVVVAMAMAIGLAGAAGAIEKTGSNKLTVISTQARVEVSAEGKVIAVQPDSKLPASVARAVQSTVAGWRFAAPMKDGKPVGGVTYVQLGACAAEVDGSLRMAFDYQGNGPRRDGPLWPQFPVEQIRPGQSAKMKMIYRVGADGVAEVESVERIEGKALSSQAFRSVMNDWIGASTFAPELVAGEPVATRMSLPVEFRVVKRDYTRSRLSPNDIEQALAAERTTCQAALGNARNQDKAAALDSPFKLLSSG